MNASVSFRAAAIIAACAASLGTAPPAVAQSSNRVAAEALFREARKLLDGGHYQEACQKLAASQRLDPAVGTLLNLARCYEKIDKTATAWATYHDAITLAHASGQAEREKTARQGADALEPALPRLTIVVSSEVAAAKPQILRDGVAVPQDLWGVTVPVDPGEHTIAASAASRKGWSTTVKLEARANQSVTVPPLDPEAAEPEAPSVPAHDALSSGAPSAPPPSTGASSSAAVGAEPASGKSQPGSGRKVAGWALAGVGVAGVVVGVIEGLQVNHHKTDADQTCGNACTDPAHADAAESLDQARTARTLSFIGFGIGAAGLVGGAVLLFTSPSSPAASARVQFEPLIAGGSVGLGMRGAW